MSRSITLDFEFALSFFSRLNLVHSSSAMLPNRFFIDKPPASADLDEALSHRPSSYRSAFCRIILCISPCAVAAPTFLLYAAGVSYVVVACAQTLVAEVGDRKFLCRALTVCQ